MIRHRRTSALFATAVLAIPMIGRALPPRYDHVVIVVEENHSLSNIMGNVDAPYINSLAATGASFSNMYGMIHPSQPNYLELFSGSIQGATTNAVPLNPQGLPTTQSPFTAPNLGAAA